jgi:hypothetical protein
MIIEILDAQSNVVLARIEMVEVTLSVLAEVAITGRSLILGGLHIQGENVEPNEVGIRDLRRVVQEVMEDLDVDHIIVEGATRSTGAGPGRTPRQLRFSRKIPAEK